MTPIAYALLTAAASAAPAPPAPVVAPGHVVTYAQMTIQQRVIIRVPAMAAPPPPPMPMPRPMVWQERKGPKCVAIGQLAGAGFSKADSVDLFLRGGRRLRAMLDDSCPALDYYAGFYIAPTKDGMVCGGRDTIHTRAGGQCEIEKFRELVPGK